MIKASILLDSVAPNGRRLVSWQLDFPRWILAEVNTHRAFSRSSASTRAIPTKKMAERVAANPALPFAYGSNKPGMSAGDELLGWRRSACELSWRAFARIAMYQSRWLSWLGLHKQHSGRWLETATNHTIILTATDYANFFVLRNSSLAQPELHELARQMQEMYSLSTPKSVLTGNWHLPLIHDCDWEAAEVMLLEAGHDPHPLKLVPTLHELIRKISVGRCARVSYLTHLGTRDLSKDVELHDRLLKDKHHSPFEHVAQAMYKDEADVRYGNFRGWRQYRYSLSGEAGPEDKLFPWSEA